MVSEVAKRREEQQSNGHGFTGNLWETMLREAMRKSRLPDSTVVFVGPQGCGKSSLLETFLEGPAYLDSSSSTTAAAPAAVVVPTTETGPESGAGVAGSGSPDAGQNAANTRGFHPVLAYSYLEAADPAEQGSERDDTPPRVSFWCCGELDFEELLQTVLQPSSLANTAVMVGVDLSRPWEIMDTVKKWTGILERHITELMKCTSVGAQDDLRNAVRERWLAAARSGVSGGKGRRVGAGRNQGEVDPSVASLGEGVLEKNLGVPMVIVGCKADSLQSGTFEQQQRLHFIQQSLRRFCLKYGAGLVYTSVKEGVNCALLHRYLLSRLYPDAFPCAEEVQTTDAAFIPAGWDSMRLINSLLSAEKTPWGPDAAFQDVMVAPPNAGRGQGSADGAVTGADLNAKPKEPEEAVESEEMWLSRLDKQVPDDGSKRSQKQPPLGRRPITKTPGELRNFFETLMRSGNNASPPKSDVPRKKI